MAQHIAVLLAVSWCSLTEKINIRVLDPFTIKPLDRKLILGSARATKGRILTVEDHYYEGNWTAPDWVGKAKERGRGRQPRGRQCIKFLCLCHSQPWRGFMELSQSAAVS